MIYTCIYTYLYIINMSYIKLSSIDIDLNIIKSICMMGINIRYNNIEISSNIHSDLTIIVSDNIHLKSIIDMIVSSKKGFIYKELSFVYREDLPRLWS